MRDVYCVRCWLCVVGVLVRRVSVGELVGIAGFSECDLIGIVLGSVCFPSILCVDVGVGCWSRFFFGWRFRVWILVSGFLSRCE